MKVYASDEGVFQVEAFNCFVETVSQDEFYKSIHSLSEERVQSEVDQDMLNVISDEFGSYETGKGKVLLKR